MRNPHDVRYYIQNDIYLDQDWVIVRSYNEFVDKISTDGMPYLITFDHDLADEHYAPREEWDRYDDWEIEQNFKEKTGKDCANWLIEHCMDNKIKLPDFLVHSANPTGAKNILSILEQYRKYESEL